MRVQKMLICICMYTNIHISMYIYVHIHIHTHTEGRMKRVRKHKHMQTHIHTRTHAHTHTHTHTHARTHVRARAHKMIAENEYGLAKISRLPQLRGLFSKEAHFSRAVLQNRYEKLGWVPTARNSPMWSFFCFRFWLAY